jgi:predicted pyridoxine 5'-phosphate oxidase superfamily flavin-nucleotide-binding protein
MKAFMASIRSNSSAFCKKALFLGKEVVMLLKQDAPSPWHEGEIRLQRRAGVAARMQEVGRRTIRDYLTDQHRAFFPQLPFAVIGAVDPAGDAWATLRAGRPGFLSSPDPWRLAVALPREPSDPADGGMDDGAAVALLGIELPTRRRNRVNGPIRRAGPNGFVVAVEQAFGNCPRYIQRRNFTFVRDPETPPERSPAELAGLDGAARAAIARADTLFVASYAEPQRGGRQVDVSHRGGRPGFVRVDSGQAGGDVLTIPDYAGNLYFNTLGNIAVNPRAGLAFVDFDSGDLLQMTGDAEVLPDGPDVASFEGAERLWRFHPRRIVRRPQALPLRWTTVCSPD